MAFNPNQPPQQPEQYEDEQAPPIVYPQAYTPEEEITNIVGQIDPQRILDNLNHSLKGEYFNKEKGEWEKVGAELANDACRGWVISYFTHIMNNASTMGILSEKQLSAFMEEIIMAVTREFKCNLEKFGFVPKGKGYDKKEYENKGPVDSSRMNSISGMIYKNALIIYSRSLKGTESSKIFRSLTMSDPMAYRGGEQQQGRGLFNRMFRR